MFNPRAAVGNGSRLSCHNIPKKIAAVPFQCSVCLRNGVKTSNVRVRQLRRSETGCTTSGGRWYCTDRSGAKIRSRERVRVRKQKKHIIDVLYKKKKRDGALKVQWTFVSADRSETEIRTRSSPAGLVYTKKERETGLEPATPTLARSCSTN